MLSVHSLTVLYWYVLVGLATVGNCFFWVRQDADVGGGARGAYTAFTVVYLLVFTVASGPLLYNAYFYATGTDKVRSTHRAVGLLWLVGDTPLLAADIALQYDLGIVAAIQGITFVLRLMSWCGGLFYVWTTGLTRVAAYLHAKTDCDAELTRHLLIRKHR